MNSCSMNKEKEALVLEMENHFLFFFLFFFVLTGESAHKSTSWQLLTRLVEN